MIKKIKYWLIIGYQSFVKDEVTPEIAHEIGVKLANELWGDRFQVIVTTHLNTNQLHNHFVINSVSFKDGKKMTNKRVDYAELRAMSDSICEEYKLSVIEEKKCQKSGIYFPNYLKNSRYRNSDYYKTTKEDIDRAIKQAYNYEDFEKIMKTMGYKLVYRADKLSVCRNGYKRNIRLHRAYGTEYSVERISERIQEENDIRVPFQEVYARKKYYSKTKFSKVKTIDKKYRSSLYRLYTYYRYKLNSYRNTSLRKGLTEEQRKALKQMNKYSEEARFLSKNKIHSTEELFLCKKSLNEEARNVILEIRKLNRKIKEAKSKDEVDNLIEMKTALYYRKRCLKEEVEICEDIENRIPKIKDAIKENEKDKEREKNERSR